MSTLHYKSYRVKVATKREGVKNFKKKGYVVCVRPLMELGVYYSVFE